MSMLDSLKLITLGTKAVNWSQVLLGLQSAQKAYNPQAGLAVTLIKSRTDAQFRQIYEFMHNLPLDRHAKVTWPYKLTYDLWAMIVDTESQLRKLATLQEQD
jgi:hypothetical protein